MQQRISAATRLETKRPTVAAVIVSYDDPEATYEALKSLHTQSYRLAEVIVVDNHPQSKAVSAAQNWDLPVRMLSPEQNLGYAGGSTFAVNHTNADWIFFLNPDAVADPRCVEECMSAVNETTAIVGAQVLLPDQQTINAGDNPVHLSGLSWSGQYQEAREFGLPRKTFATSGAALLVRRSAFVQLGMYRKGTFMYYDDVDLAWRAQLAGWDVLFCPDATVVHNYTFEKGHMKWYWLERNRLWAVLAYYEKRTLLLLFPFLFFVEIGIMVFALHSGWFHLKIKVYQSLGSHRKEMLAWRNHFQSTRRMDDCELVKQLESSFHSQLIRIPCVVAIDRAVSWYKRFVLFVLRLQRKH